MIFHTSISEALAEGERERGIERNSGWNERHLISFDTSLLTHTKPCLRRAPLISTAHLLWMSAPGVSIHALFYRKFVLMCTCQTSMNACSYAGARWFCSFNKACVGGLALWHLMCQRRCHKHKTSSHEKLTPRNKFMQSSTNHCRARHPWKPWHSDNQSI